MLAAQKIRSWFGFGMISIDFLEHACFPTWNGSQLAKQAPQTRSDFFDTLEYVQHSEILRSDVCLACMHHVSFYCFDLI